MVLKRVLKTAAYAAVGMLRVLGVRRVAHAAATTRSWRGRTRTQTFSVSEPAPTLRMIGDQPPPPCRPIDSDWFVIDSEETGFTFRNNHLLDPDRRVVYEPAIRFRDLPISKRILESTSEVSGTVAYLSNTWPDNYYHWLCKTLPLLQIYRERTGEPDFVYLGRPLRRWHVESLALIGVSSDRILTKGVAPTRIVAAIPNRRGGVDTASLQFVANGLSPKTSRGHELLAFIGRGRTRRRMLVNERECAERLRKHGLQFVTLDGKSVREQTELFSSAKVIVAAHGAALTNLLFASPETTVIELMPPRSSSRTSFAEIAAVRGCRYGRLSSESCGRDRVQIDIDRVEALVEAVLAGDA